MNEYFFFPLLIIIVTRLVKVSVGMILMTSHPCRRASMGGWRGMGGGVVSWLRSRSVSARCLPLSLQGTQGTKETPFLCWKILLAYLGEPGVLVRGMSSTDLQICSSPSGTDPSCPLTRQLKCLTAFGRGGRALRRGATGVTEISVPLYPILSLLALLGDIAGGHLQTRSE